MFQPACLIRRPAHRLMKHLPNPRGMVQNCSIQMHPRVCLLDSSLAEDHVDDSRPGSRLPGHQRMPTYLLVGNSRGIDPEQ